MKWKNIENNFISKNKVCLQVVPENKRYKQDNLIITDYMVVKL